MKFFPSSLGLTVLLLSGHAGAQNEIVLPAGYESVEALSSHTFPWASASTFAPLGCRVQMVYDSVYFTSQGWSGSLPVQRLRWRADGLSNPSSTGGAYSDVIVEMSTAAVDHRQLSDTFDDNHGVDRRTVYTGTVALLPTGNQTPNVYYIDLLLTESFAYDPAAGDLLIDVQVPNSWVGGTPARTDVESGGSFGRSVEASMVFNRVASTAVSGDVLNDVGHVVAVEFGGAQQAAATPYGQGCSVPPAPAITLEALSRPVTGARFDIAAQNLPVGTTAGYFVLGVARLDPGLSLTSLGATNCTLHVDLGALAVVDPFAPFGAIGLGSYPVPPDATLVGSALFLQTLAVVPGANPLALLASNGLHAVVGAF